MDISLLDIKEDVTKYINIISNLVKVDVGVVDSNMMRITGTGVYKATTGNKAVGSVLKNTIETGKTHIIENPRYHQLCSECIDKDICREKLEISTPIYCKDKIIGGLWLVCFNDSQKNKILEELDSFLLLTKQIAEFIGIKYFEHKEKVFQKQKEYTLNSIISSMDKGVIIYDKDNKIVNYNNVAIKKIEDLKIGDSIEVVSQADYCMGEEIFKLIIDRQNYDIVGKIIPLEFYDNQESKVLLFDDLTKLNNNIAEVTNNYNSISIKDIYGKSLWTEKLRENIVKLANTNSTVLITGESGTGKELVARALHWHSARRDKPFVAINCSAIPDTLLESELFGYAKGAFTGANSTGRMGKFELANNGVIFLDEIGDMPLYLQAKILRVIQEKKIERIGSNKSIDLDIRIIAATNVNLENKIKEQKFRMDLYYRLNVIPIKLLPLRERKEDILPIVEKLLKKYNNLSYRYISSISEEVKDILLKYDWPGNIRELENVIELMFNMADNSGVLGKELLPNALNLSEDKCIQTIIQDEMKDFDELEDFEIIEKKYIQNAFKKYGVTTESKKLISQKMNIGLTTLYRKMKKFDIS